MRRMHSFRFDALWGVLLGLWLSLAGVAAAQQSVGAVTNLSLPRFVSMKTSEAFARRGPGKIHKIDWTFVRRSLLVTGETVEMFSKPAGVSRLVAKLEPGVVGKLLTCEAELCKIETQDGTGGTYEGWVRREALWGLTETD